ncbi:MAG: TIGR03089 family protein [Winkia neuii]|uniref:TIGR03089 family protein n=1 Tax=Winkia neuii TaxID=33007 RepID=UPI0029035020|nr:TIGR03089 family protein [Winkia neuii]MDU3134563.1 TIGR03089 family protein [Winkia neuii]
MNLVSLVRDLDSRVSPALTSYIGGERLELTGHVLANWLSKIANLIVSNEGGPTAGVLIDLPLHWRSVCWTVGTWHASAPVGGPEPVWAVTDNPEKATSWVDQQAAEQVSILSLPALDLTYPGSVPAGCVDAAAETMANADSLVWAEEPDPTVALFEGGPTFAEVNSISALPPQRLVIGGSLNAVCLQCVRMWAGGGSVVLVPPEATSGELEKTMQTERAGLGDVNLG